MTRPITGTTTKTPSRNANAYRFERDARRPYHRANEDVRPGYRAQIRALVPQGTAPDALPGLAERLARRHQADFFLVAFYDRVEAVNLFRGNSAPTSEAERGAWRCNVTVNFGRAEGGCRAAGGRDLATP